MDGKDLPTEDENQWVEQYLPLVRYVVSRMAPPTSVAFSFDDMVSLGVVGLLQARTRYEPSRGSFSSFAVPRIRGAIIDAIRVNDFLPRNVRRDLRLLESLEQEACALTGEFPSRQELQERAGISPRRIDEARRAAGLTIVPMELDGDVEQDAQEREIPDDAPGPAEIFLSQELISEVAGLVESLPERERMIVALHFVEGLTMKQIARVLGVSESRVSQLQSRAIERLRRSLKAA